jgi:uncharacterized protein YoxC
MTVQHDGEIQNENTANENDFDLTGSIANAGRIFITYAYSLAVISALVLSIVAVLLLRKDDATLPQNKDEIRSLRQKLTPCLTNGTYPIFLRKIRQLSSKIEAVKTNLTQLMTEIKSSLETNITHVETSLNKRLAVLQSQVSNLKTNAKELQTNFGKFQELTNYKFKQIWEKFDEVESEIAQKHG